MEEKDEYWFCTIGPIKRSELKVKGVDGPMRAAVETAFLRLLNRDAHECASGWGMLEEVKIECRKIRIEKFLKKQKEGEVKMKKIERGNVVKDTVTGFQGIAAHRIVYLNGCVQFCVIPEINWKAKDGKMPKGEYIDQGRLQYVSKGIPAQTETEPPGGVMRDCPKH